MNPDSPSPRFTESSLRNDHQDEDLDSNAKRVGPGKSRVFERIEQRLRCPRSRHETHLSRRRVVSTSSTLRIMPSLLVTSRRLWVISPAKTR